MKLSKYIFLYSSILCLCLSGCSKVSSKDDLEVNKSDILDLKEQTQEVVALDDIMIDMSSPVETTLDSLDDIGVNNNIVDNNETNAIVIESSESTSSVKDVVNNLPVDNILNENNNSNIQTYNFLGVDINYISGLLFNSFSEYPDSYISEDSTIYLLHNQGDRVVTLDEIKDKFISDGVLEDDIYVDVLGNKTLVMAGFVDETASSYMAYLIDDKEVHLFVLAKVGESLEDVKNDMMDILNSAQFESDVVDIYWKDKTVNEEFKVENIAGIDVAIGKSWELISTTSSTNILYKVDDKTNVSFAYLELDDSLKTETLDSYISVVKNSFGEPLELNTLQFKDSDVIWTEFVYKDITVSNKKANIGVYIANLESGLLYIEMSTDVNNELQYNNIKGIINYLNNN